MNDRRSPDPLNIPPFRGRTPTEEASDQEQGIRGTMTINGREIKVKESDNIEEIVKNERAGKR